MPSKRCKTPSCKSKPVSRGVCQACYMAHMRSIKAGKTTWDDLIEAGLVNERRGRESKARAALRKAGE